MSELGKKLFERVPAPVRHGVVGALLGASLGIAITEVVVPTLDSIADGEHQVSSEEVVGGLAVFGAIAAVPALGRSAERSTPTNQQQDAPR